MADNISVKDASGATVTVRTKDNAGIHTQQFGNEAASQVDGHSATIGATTDVAITTNAAGTLSGKLRGLLTIYSDIWSAALHATRVVNPDDSLIGAVQLVSATAVVTTVASSATVITLKAANVDRMGLSVYNNSTQRLFIKFGTGASTIDYSVVLGPLDSTSTGDYWEHPQGYIYTGIVTGCWFSANGSAHVTEFTA